MAKAKPAGVKAARNQKMIELRVRFWTNDIAAEKNNVVPKHGWTSGVISMESNPTHDIHPKNPKPFLSLMDLTAVMEKVLQEHGVVLHPSRKMKKVVTDA